MVPKYFVISKKCLFYLFIFIFIYLFLNYLFIYLLFLHFHRLPLQWENAYVLYKIKRKFTFISVNSKYIKSRKVKTSKFSLMKILMFSTHSMKYIWYSPQKEKICSHCPGLALRDRTVALPWQTEKNRGAFTIVLKCLIQPRRTVRGIKNRVKPGRHRDSTGTLP